MITISNDGTQCPNYTTEELVQCAQNRAIKCVDESLWIIFPTTRSIVNLRTGECITHPKQTFKVRRFVDLEIKVI